MPTSAIKYTSDNELREYMNGNTLGQANVPTNLLSTTTNGIEGLPYQFMESVDRRITGTTVGRRYGEKIFGRLPLLFLTPCEPLFMDDFSNSDSSNVADALVSTLSGSGTMNGVPLEGTGKYYSVDFAYTEYYKYLNTMLTCVSAYLGLANREISLNGSPQKIGRINWQNELNDSFKTFFSASENLIFYLDGMESISESFQNNTTESSLASMINGFSDQANEVRFLFGKNGNAVANLIDAGAEITSNITSSLSSALGEVGGGIIGSLANKGVNSVLNGGKIIFPEIWQDSDFSRSYNIEIKLRSPDHDNLSIFLNILKPYCKLLALMLPREMQDTNSGERDPNAYTSPFLVRGYSKGLFNVDMGIITSMSVNKGALCAWNDDGLPTQIDISLEIKDLYSRMSMSKVDGFDFRTMGDVVNNTSYMDFLANMAGLNVGQLDVGRRMKMLAQLVSAAPSRMAGDFTTRLDQGVSKLIGKMYNIF